MNAIDNLSFEEHACDIVYLMWGSLGNGHPYMLIRSHCRQQAGMINENSYTHFYTLFTHLQMLILL